MRRLLLSLAVLSSLATSMVATVPVAHAQSEGLIIECDRAVLKADGTVDETKTKRCGVEQFVAQFVRLAQWGLTIVVFIAVLMLVYGGFEFITAGGRQTKISSGQNIISGTIIGLAISMTAYVIINFSVGAITGTKTSSNPFTAISTVFGGKEIDSQSITKPFSGVGDKSSSPNCRAAWDTTCSNQVYCADPEEDGSNGQIATFQGKLQGFGCGCKVDGCFGAEMAQCIRQFQIANNLVPSGALNENTLDTLLQANPQRCDSNAARINAVLNNLPKTTTGFSKSLNSTDTGCCVVQKNVSGADRPLYCINDISERGCAALGSGYKYASGKACAEDPGTIPLCGFCRDTANGCFEEVGKYWCDSVAKSANGNAMTFQQGVCRGGGVCGSCTDTLKTAP